MNLSSKNMKHKPLFYVAAILLAVAFCIALGFWGHTILGVLGIRFRSAGWLLLFVLLLFVFGVPIDLLSELPPKMLYQKGKLKSPKGWLYALLDVSLNFAMILVVDFFLKPVTVHWLSALVLCVALCLLNLSFEKKEGQQGKKANKKA